MEDQIGIIDLISNKINELIDYTFNIKDIQKSISDYISILSFDKISNLSYNNITVNKPASSKLIEDIDIKHQEQSYKIDVKSYDVNKTLTVPNLISIDKARKCLSNKNNHIIYIFVNYQIVEDAIKIVKIFVKPIESLDWSYLDIQNIGKGQLQIKSLPNGIFFTDNVTRKEWLDKLIKKGEEYYEELLLRVFDYKNNWLDNEKWKIE